MAELDQEILQELQEWAGLTEAETKAWIRKNINKSGKLEREFSIKAAISAPGQFHIEVDFPRYGIYRNFGAGLGYAKGIKIVKSPTAGYKKGPVKKREPAPFYTQIFWSNLREIRELMAEKYQKYISLRIINELKEK